MTMGHEQAALAGQVDGVDLDAELEEQQHDANIGENRELLAIGHVARVNRETGSPAAR